jgi:hypothetical protein
MVNREVNFNRKKVKRLKTIRDKKRARVQRKKQHLRVEDDYQTPLTKKLMKRQQRLENIYKELKEDKSVLKEKPKKRRSKRGGKKHKKNNTSNMQVEN